MPRFERRGQKRRPQIDWCHGWKIVLIFELVRVINWFWRTMKKKFRRDKEYNNSPRLEFIVENVGSMSETDGKSFNQVR